MNNYLDIFNDVIRLATLQPRSRQTHPTPSQPAEPQRERIARTPRALKAREF